MNINEAKKEIKNTLRAYLLKDEQGKYTYPIQRQRPILLMGPPGIGKTAILSQIAEEAQVGMVSYSLTHHTRQSAVGLPHIEKKNFSGEEISVTEYTMSDIIGAVYSCMERSGRKEGILFIDEVNCVSETLAPTMLELLQNKTFGSHKVPEGWILVTAGNPPEYNKSVREFDVATLDRVRTISVEPDCGAWLAYAMEHQGHGAIRSYLAIKPENFYLVEDRAEGKSFVTARGWEDLSELLKSYELLHVPVSTEVIREFLQKEDIARDFGAYYALYLKYDEDYEIMALLDGQLTGEAWDHKAELAKKGSFEEKFTVVGLICDGLSGNFRQWSLENHRLKALREQLLRLKRSWNGGPGALAETMKKSLQVKINAGIAEKQQILLENYLISQLEDYGLELKKAHVSEEDPGFDLIRQRFTVRVQALQDLGKAAGEKLHRAFLFLEQCFDDGQELTLFMTNLTQDENAMAFLMDRGSEDFLRHSEILNYRDQEKKLLDQCRILLETEDKT